MAVNVIQNTLCKLIQNQVGIWKNDILSGSQHSIVGDILRHIQNAGELRPPQVEAIETYLWLKFEGQNKKLADIICSGLLYDEDIASQYNYHRILHTGSNKFLKTFLNGFFEDNNLKNLRETLLDDPQGENNDWIKLLNDLFHDFQYPNYFYSLPMGAGKTFLMACFIYLDLYFASFLKNDSRFAHNFVVFAPHASKTAILPSLTTIKDFQPEWILPKSDAQRLKQLISVEILDYLGSKRKDKLHSRNPNLEKVNRMRQSQDFGLIFITNAEKVVLEKYTPEDQLILKDVKRFRTNLLAKKKVDEIRKTNELRDALSQIRQLQVILDEGHHAYSPNNKLREAVKILNQHHNVNSVIGFSGTPYVNNTIHLGDQKIKFNQIQDVVYNYPLHLGIGRFLKKPRIISMDIKDSEFMKEALTDFFNNYNIEYSEGIKSKIAFYCPNIAKLNEEILPVIQAWYNQHRPLKADKEIFKYYSNSKTANKDYKLPKDSKAIFDNLDKPYSTKRVILLVAIGKEGWDCKSLTSVVLPRQKTTRNFVLQTTCRCLREVNDASKEIASIYLSKSNYETLDKELKANHKLSIDDITAKHELHIPVDIRKPELGRLSWKQVYNTYHEEPYSIDVKRNLEDFTIQKIKNDYPYDHKLVRGIISQDGLQDISTEERLVSSSSIGDLSFNDFIYTLSNESYGVISERALIDGYEQELRLIWQNIKLESSWISGHPHLDYNDICKFVVMLFMQTVRINEEVETEEVEIELLQWRADEAVMSYMAAREKQVSFLPELEDGISNRYQEIIFRILDEKLKVNDPTKASFNYAPYKFDSDFEKRTLRGILKLPEIKNLEIYFNGYRNNDLQSFCVRTPYGKYTPDFLILKRKGNKKYSDKNTRDAVSEIEKMLIIETKGEIYYDNFKAKEHFVKNVFIPQNSHLEFICLLDKKDNIDRFEANIANVIKLIKEFLND